MKSTASLTLAAAVFISTSAAAQPKSQISYVCKFTEYAWYHLDNVKRVMPQKSAEEYVFSFEPPKQMGTVIRGTYKNLVGGWSDQVLVMGNPSRYTIIEDTNGDNAFIVSIFSEKTGTGEFKAAMTSHTIFFGISQQQGSCR